MCLERCWRFESPLNLFRRKRVSFLSRDVILFGSRAGSAHHMTTRGYLPDQRYCRAEKQLRSFTSACPSHRQTQHLTFINPNLKHGSIFFTIFIMDAYVIPALLSTIPASSCPSRLNANSLQSQPNGAARIRFSHGAQADEGVHDCTCISDGMSGSFGFTILHCIDA